ncbi:hypothetical protein ABIE09_002358 [Lysobacter enzymogenes]|uniref:hypothetical protein n=1 Tax=Lysobacter enzymogenes TaxID=69 RepID=UPI003396D27F
MVKIKGLDALQKDLATAQRAMEAMGEELGTVQFNPTDPESIEQAIQTVNRMVDERLGMYADNFVVGPLIEQMKERYRDMILQKAAEARLTDGDE